MQGILDELSNQIGTTYRDRLNQSNQRQMQNTGIVAKTEEMLLADSLAGDRQGQQNEFLLEKMRQELEARSKDDSSRYANELLRLREQLDATSKKDSLRSATELAKYKMELDGMIKKLGLTYDAGREEKKYDAELEKKKLRDAYIPPNLRGGLADFFNEDKTMGLDESEMIEEYGKSSGELRQMIGELNRLDIPKNDPRRKSAENLVMDVWKHLNMSDQGKDFLDGGGILGWLGVDNTEEIQAKAVYDEVQTMLMQLGIPQEEWKNRRWIQKGY
tara:strand:- start:30527 stop:31348 length:822 start_codon:yes stop_codon:yes gene_type:complete